MKNTKIAARARGCAGALRHLTAVSIEGRVAAISGIAIELEGFAGHLAIGDRLTLLPRGNRPVPAEVVGFRAGRAYALPFAPVDGLGPGHPARIAGRLGATLSVSDGWLGRVIDSLG